MLILVVMENKYLILDIETCPIHTWDELPENLKNIWIKKAANRFDNCSNIVLKYDENASFFSLFSKIICVSISSNDRNEIHSFIGDEKTILNKLKTFIQAVKIKFNPVFVGHNLIAFDLPFILQRSIINQIEMPVINKIINCKPWETPAYDTMLMFQMTSKEWYSLDYICAALNIESPKNEMQGNQVAENYRKGNIDKIAKYCESDVFATKKVFNILINNFKF